MACYRSGPTFPHKRDSKQWEHYGQNQESETHLGHELDPPAGGVVDGVQLLQERAGVGQREVALHEAAKQITVRNVQDIWVILKICSNL